MLKLPIYFGHPVSKSLERLCCWLWGDRAGTRYQCFNQVIETGFPKCAIVKFWSSYFSLETTKYSEGSSLLPCELFEVGREGILKVV